jgi:hypothetical protein
VVRFSSMFSQLLKLFPRTEFQALVKRTHAERHARGFTCWGQFVAMLFCQLGRAHSLREICDEVGLPDQPSEVRCDDDCRHLQGPLAIELFFKALKQNLKMKTFVGTSANALKIQMWTALVAMLVLKYMQLRSQSAWSLSNLLRMNLFTHRDLWAWLDQPFEGPPEPEAGVEQAVLGLG